MSQENVVEIEEKVEAKPEPEAPTLESLAAEGFNAQELKDAQELGMVAKPGEEKPKDDKKPEAKKVEEPKKPTPEEYDAAWKKAQFKPEFANDPAKEEEHTKEFTVQEKQLWKAQKIAYHKQKTAEAERAAVEARAKANEARIKELEDKLAKVAPELDADGNPIKPEEKKNEPTDEEKRAQAEILARREQEHVEDAKARYTDFDEVIAMTQEIIKNPQEVFKDNMHLFTKAKALYGQFMRLYGQPVEAGQYNAADVAYEIGLLHPNFKKGAAPAKGERDGAVPKSETQKLSPAQLDRTKETTRRQSSASLPTGGGSKRVISYDDLTPEDAEKMSDEAFGKLPLEVQDRLLGKV